MQDYLAFTLAAPFASFGSLAVGERRPSSDHPSKSQIVGLVASALGIERIHEAHQRELATNLSYAVCMDDAGRPAVDFHTAEIPDPVSKRRWVKANGPITTRRNELSCDERKTILSMREYRTGVLATVVLWQKAPMRWTLDEIAERLRKPCFTLYLGRKAFPLMLPVRPFIVRAASSIEAVLEQYDASRTDAEADFAKTYLLGRLGARGRAKTLYADADAVTQANHRRIETRRDVPASRAKWGFGVRQEHVITLSSSEEDA